MKNKYFIRSRISEAKFREIIKLFSGDLTACQIVLFSGVSRMCVNRTLKQVRIRIAEFCEQESIFMSFFFFLLSFFISYEAFSDYKCQTDNDCLRVLHEDYLDRDSDRSLYRYCEAGFESNKACCIDPFSCSEPWGEELSSQIRQKSMNLANLGVACERKAFFGDFQKSMCSVAVEKCKANCKNALEEFKRNFKICFRIPASLSLDEVLEKSKAPVEDHLCYEEMRNLAEKYKLQSLDEKELRSELKPEDIVKCEEIEGAGTPAVLNAFKRMVCQLGRDEKRRLEEEDKKRKAREEARSLEQQKFQERERLREEEQARKRKEEAKRIEEVARQIKKDRMRLDQLEGLKGSSTASTPVVSNSSLSPAGSFSQNSKTIFSKKQGYEDKASAGFFPASARGQVVETSKTRRESRRGFFGKAVDKVKSGFKNTVDKVRPVFRKGVDFVKGLLPFMDSEKELMAKARWLCRAKSRLVSLSQVVYQSVKAPQIERQDEEGRIPFDDYELVIDKPAGVIVKIRKSHLVRREGFKSLGLDFDADELIGKFDFFLSLKIDGRPYNETLCSESLRKEDVEFKQDILVDPDPKQTDFIAENAHCVFNWSDLKDDYIYKFISLPTGLGEPLGENLGSVEVEILSQLKPKNSLNNKFVEFCESREKWTVNMLEPKSFKVIFTGMAPPPISECKEKDEDNEGEFKQIFTITNEQDVWDYLTSTEVTKDFYDMFPVSKRRPNKPQIELLTNHRNELVFPIGSCKKGNEGVFLDSLSLLNKKEDYEADFILSVFTKSYRKYHNLDKDLLGRAYTLFPERYIRIPFFGDRFFGRKIRKGIGILLAGAKKTGTFLHEMGHIFGQKKDHYKEEDPYYCKQFTRRGKLPGKEELLSSKDEITGISCYDYRVTGGLVRERDVRPRLSQEPRRQHWKLLNNQRSFMHGSTVMEYRGIYQQWIDRETYQKALATLENNLFVPKDFIDRIKGRPFYQKPKVIQIKQKLDSFINCSLKKRPVIKVSGLYNKKADKKNRLTGFLVKAQTLKSQKNPFSLGEFSIVEKEEEEDYVKIQLKKHGKVEEELVFPRIAYVESFYKDKSSRREELDMFPVFGSFYPVCNSFFNSKGYSISVKEVYMENGIKKEDTLMESIPVSWKKESMEI